MLLLLKLQTLAVAVAMVAGRPNYLEDHEDSWHSISRIASSSQSVASRASLEDEAKTDYWKQNAQAAVREKINRQLNTNTAKNVIMFLGDGMSVPTLMAARTYLGQLQGRTGEEESLSFERFPFTGLSKTYCVDYQVPDSACTATAYLTGIKANEGTIGVNANVARRDCVAQTNTSNHVSSIAQWALNEGKSAGVVTTTRITHASPAGVYARTANRDWESDADIISDGFDPTVCTDIATQLMTTSPGMDFQVILGGGRREFLPNTTVDDEGTSGRRRDGVDLIETWKQDKTDRDSTHSYVWNRSGLRKIIDNPGSVDYLLGLFEDNHCQYHKLSVAETEPTLTEMTEAAIKILEKNSNGYFLFVEGGRIDHAHHENWANLALDETVQFAAAIQAADELTDESDTLIVVTSDHAHVMSISGYPLRGNDILGLGGVGDDGLAYATLSYANGPAYVAQVNGTRHDLTEDDLTDPTYGYPAMVPRDSETHGADDVAIFARGPWSHLFTGVLEQHTIPHFMAYASCVGTGITACTPQN